MRIAIFSECYSPVTNGVVTSILTLRETLLAMGHTVYVFAPGTQQPEDDADIFRLPELPFPRHPYHFARPFPRLNVDFASLNVDIVHCQHPFVIGRLGAETARKHNLPMVYTAHSLYDTMVACSKSPLLRTMGPQAMRGVVRRFCAKADCVIVPSRFTRDALKADRVKARFSIIPSGILGPNIQPGMRETMRKQFDFASETPVILYVGRLGPEKRIDVLLRAVAAIPVESLPAFARNFRVLIVGDGQSQTDLEALTDELHLRNRVLFVGAQPHASIGKWYAAGDIFALPCPVETQGMVLVEAMAAGLPCIAINAGGAQEVIVDGETGLRIPLETETFCDALLTLLSSPELCREMGENGRERATLYEPEAMARRVLSVYERAISLPRREDERGVQKLATGFKRRRTRITKGRRKAMP